ncbi:MAG: cytidylyltransferase domain-containing protein [Phototrophicaceae bacterium]
MKILGLIPARGGSKQVPKKNIRMLGGKPLIAYTLEAVQPLNNLFYRTIVSTDDEQIAQIARDFGGDVPFMRPSELAQDRSPTIPLVQHAILEIESRDQVKLDWVMLLQPTAPLRRTEHILEAIQLAQACPCDSVISLRRVFAEHPILMKKIENDRVVSYCVEEREGTRRQDYDPPAYMRNGAIYLTKRDVVIHDNSLWGKSIYPLVMDEESSVNIDSMLDFELAELVMKKRQA